MSRLVPGCGLGAVPVCVAGGSGMAMLAVAACWRRAGRVLEGMCCALGPSVVIAGRAVTYDAPADTIFAIVPLEGQREAPFRSERNPSSHAEGVPI